MAVVTFAGHVIVQQTALHAAPLMISEKALMLPVSPVKKSVTVNVHVPFGSSPLKADKRVAGVKLPVNGAFALTTLCIDGPPD